jgi:NAD(P)-dependent dehydrogenase (short-subunit alcohol dehydrogenase family)
MSGRLEGKKAIVSGASRGMGAAIARAFHDEGAAVLAVDVLADEGQRLAAEVDSERFAFEPVDVTSSADWEQAVEVCGTRFGPVDVLVNNAGILGSALPVHEESDDGWRAVLDVNLTGVFNGMRAVLPTMIAQQRGAIVNTSSIWGSIAAANSSAYHATKGAVTVLTKNAAVTYAEQGIRVNSVHPGLIDTELSRGLNEEETRWLLDRIPANRKGRPDDVAPAVVFLASDEADYITGTGLFVDGGFTAL